VPPSLKEHFRKHKVIVVQSAFLTSNRNLEVKSNRTNTNLRQKEQEEEEE